MELLSKYALSFVGLPYRWGGDSPLAGFDCSGLCVEILKSAGAIEKDMSAQGLFDFFRNAGEWSKYSIGSLAFFGEAQDKISHVGFCLDKYRMLEAGGGGSKTVSLELAQKQGAYVRIRPINHRKDLVAVIMPYYQMVLNKEIEQ